MFELVQVGEHTYYIESPAKIGVYQCGENEVILIDSGNDKDAGRKIRKLLDAREWHVKAIVNTHSNADHIGGNAYLARQTGCPIFANGIEQAYTKWPILETSFLYGGYPPKDLRHKFLLAQESPALSFDDPAFPKELKPIDLPGHFYHMTGFRTPDDVVFLADCINSEDILAKYHVGFIYNVTDYLKTLDVVEKMKAALFVPSHAAPAKDIAPLVRINRDKVLAIGDHLCELCQEPAIFEDILKGVFDDYDLTMDFEQYVLVGSTIRSYLSWLRDNGRLDVVFTDNRLTWKAL